jgi:hypothetical protein
VSNYLERPGFPRERLKAPSGNRDGLTDENRPARLVTWPWDSSALHRLPLALSKSPGLQNATSRFLAVDFFVMLASRVISLLQRANIMDIL